MTEKLKAFELEKGVIYLVDNCYDNAMHYRAEYHSSTMRHVDGQQVHNMIIRMIDSSLEMVVFLNSDIKGVADIQHV